MVRRDRAGASSRCSLSIRAQRIAKDACVALEPFLTDNLRGPLSALSARPKFLGDAGEQNAHCREPLLTVYHPVGLHYSRRPGLGESEKRATVVGCFRPGFGHCHQILDQAFDVGSIPAISTLPTGNDVLNLPVQEIEKFNVLSVHPSCSIA